MVNTGGHQPDFRLNSTGAGVFTVQLCNCDENIKILFHIKYQNIQRKLSHGMHIKH